MKSSRITMLCVMLIGMASLNLASQTIVIPDTLRGWDQTWVAGLNGSQASYDNWSEGGASSISTSAQTVYTRYYRYNRSSYGFRINMRYGQSRIEGEGLRKTDDLISLRNRFNYVLEEDGKIAIYATVQFKTQFAEGFEYGKAALGADSLISKFMAPGYLTEGLGLEYKVSEQFQIESGIGLKQTFVSDGDLSPNYGLVRGDRFRSEGGLTTGISYRNKIFENINYSSNLETFTNLLLPLNKTDVLWTNELAGKINSKLQASFQFEIRYDDDFSREVQVKQVLAVGLIFNFY